MLHRLTDLFPRGAKPPHQAIVVPANMAAMNRRADDRKPTYSKVFRFTVADAQGKTPHTVEIVGSFTHWRPVTLPRLSAHGNWQANIEEIEGNKTHHYMLLLDGKPAPYPHSDGYAKPEGPNEERYALETARGPRVYMLFAQTK
jgi:hypothetical protein